MKVQLDAMLSVAQTARWLGMSEAHLRAISPRKVPMFRIGRKTVRGHPRTIIAQLAANAGVKPEVVSAGLASFLARQV